MFGLFAIASCGPTFAITSSEMRNNIDSSVRALINNLVDDPTTNCLEGFTFDMLGEWYNRGGYGAATFFELLDLSKWAVDKDFHTTTSSNNSSRHNSGNSSNRSTGNYEGSMDRYYGSGNANVEMDLEEYYNRYDSNDGPSSNTTTDAFNNNTESSGNSSSYDNNVALEFNLASEDDNIQLQLHENTVFLLKELVTSTGLLLLQPLDILRLFGNYIEYGKITKNAFDSIIREFIPGHSLSDDEKQEFSRILSTIYYGYDRQCVDIVDIFELIIGLTILCGGNKSMKLTFAFDLLDEDEDGFLTRRQVWKLVRSLLVVLLGEYLLF